jgi:hypothetical protein
MDVLLSHFSDRIPDMEKDCLYMHFVRSNSRINEPTITKNDEGTVLQSIAQTPSRWWCDISRSQRRPPILIQMSGRRSKRRSRASHYFRPLIAST